MYKPGEPMICIKNGSGRKKYTLTIGKTYLTLKNNDLDPYITIYNDLNMLGSYRPSIFVTLIEYRRLKLKKICSKLEI